MRILKFLLVLGVVAAAGVWAFLERPWSPYKPGLQGAVLGEENAAYNHRNMDEFFQHHIVSAGQRVPLPRAPHDLPALTVEGFEGDLAAHLERNKTTALMIIKDGTVLFENHWQGGDTESRYTSWSAAKSFTSTMVGIALQKGLIKSLEDRADAYAPKLRGTAFEGVTIRQLMNMSSGMKIDKLNLPGGAQAGDTVAMMQDWIVWQTAFSDQIANFERAAQPGTVWSYNNLDTHALLMVVEGAGGAQYAQLVSDWLWQPLGAVADATWLTNADSPDAEAIGFCCLQARAEDYARLGLLMLADGQWNGQRLLPEGWVADVTTVDEPYLQEKGYQLQWWIDMQRQGVFAARGRWGQSVYVSQPHNVVVVRMSVDPDEMAHGRERWEFDAAMANWAAQQ